MTGLDIEGVLAAHRYWSDMMVCACDPDGPVISTTDHSAHVAAVLREQIVAAQAEAWDEGWSAVRNLSAALDEARGFINKPALPTNPYRAPSKES